jgi:hypothetical protein
MHSDPIRGQTIRFTFSDGGPIAKNTFEHLRRAFSVQHGTFEYAKGVPTRAPLLHARLERRVAP